MNTQEIIIAGGSEEPLKVKRFGYGSMRLTGEQIWGEPANRPEALKILKQCIKSGINFIDTADYYGEDVTNRLINEALYPYPDDLVICTKVGCARKPDKSWITFNRPENLRASIDNNLRTLKLDRIKLVHFRVIPGDVPLEESMGAMFEMQKEGKILHVGISNVSPGELQTAMAMSNIATVENMYGHGQRVSLKQAWGEETRGGEEVLAVCEENKIPLIPYFSLVNSMPKKDDRIAVIAKKHNATAAQINIAWLLHRSPWILPIPGTSSLNHLEENLKAAEIKLSEEDMKFLE